MPATGISIPVTNPYIPADLRTLLDSRPDPTADFTFRQRMEGVGPRAEQQRLQRLPVARPAVRGDVGEILELEYLRIHFAACAATEVLNNDVSLSAPGRTARLRARGGTDECDGGYNPFGGPGDCPPDCANYLRAYFTNRTSLEHQMAEATLGGKAFKMPAGDAQFSVGVSWRDEQFQFDPDSAIARGDSVGFLQQAPLDGSFDMKELFAELYLPVLDGARFAKNLGFTLGARVSDHSSSGVAESYKLEGTWQPAESVRFRSSYQRAVRAPFDFRSSSPRRPELPGVAGRSL